MLGILPGALPPNSTQHAAKTFLLYAVGIKEEELIPSYGNSVLTPRCGSSTQQEGGSPTRPSPTQGGRQAGPVVL